MHGHVHHFTGYCLQVYDPDSLHPSDLMVDGSSVGLLIATGVFGTAICWALRSDVEHKNVGSGQHQLQHRRRRLSDGRPGRERRRTTKVHSQSPQNISVPLMGRFNCVIKCSTPRTVHKPRARRTLVAFQAQVPFTLIIESHKYEHAWYHPFALEENLL